MSGGPGPSAGVSEAGAGGWAVEGVSDLAAGRRAGPGCLDAAWSALNGAGIRWALLRGSPDATDGDIDLLVDADAGPLLDRTLAAAGFARLAAIGHGGHRFYRTYDEAVDQWLTLDVVTELAFGPGGWLRLAGAAGPVLQRRLTGDVAGSGVARLHPADAFWALLLHDLLDRGDLKPAHRRDLADLAPGASVVADLGQRVDAVGGTGTADRLVRLLSGPDDDPVLAAGRRLGKRWLRATAADAIPRRIGHEVLRRLRKPHTALRRRGIDVAVLGPDGAGKSTVAAALTGSVPMPTRTIYLGLYGSGLGGSKRLGLARRMARLWGGWLRGLWHRLRGRIVVYDRHALDVRIADRPRSAKGRIRRWILVHAIPNPALILVLDVPAEVLFARKGEHDVATLDRQRRAYLAVAASVHGAEVVDAARDAESVRRDVIARTWARQTGTGPRG